MECERCGCDCVWMHWEEGERMCSDEAMHPDAPDCQACDCTCDADDGCED